MTENSNGPITSLIAAREQHMLFLFFPLKAGKRTEALGAAQEAVHAAHKLANADVDPRIATGVHYFMFYTLAADTEPAPKLPVPSFKTAPGRDLLVVMSIYDRDFAPYIGAFTGDPTIAAGLDAILKMMDEPDSVDPTDTSSAIYIEKNGGVAQNPAGFLKLLMRYNFADPTIPAANVFPVNTPKNPKYLLGATFPGLTVEWILANYPGARTLWPLPPQKIVFAPSVAPPKSDSKRSPARRAAPSDRAKR